MNESPFWFFARHLAGATLGMTRTYPAMVFFPSGKLRTTPEGPLDLANSQEAGNAAPKLSAD
jgi:hypothetical protein